MYFPNVNRLVERDGVRDREKDRNSEREKVDELDVNYDRKNAANGDLRSLWTEKMEELICKTIEKADS